MQKPDIHPLIKAAVAQAYLLVTRPFPEGNERLSRMMSSAVLLRSGYDFFRDISISSVIARESYRYYKCMCEIIRSENGGDLTYFLQYYLELLVRALDVRNERQRKREQEAREREEEALRQERELARQPLMPMAQPSEENIIDSCGEPDDEDGMPLPKPPAPVDDEPEDAEDVDVAAPESPFVNVPSRIMPPVPLMEPEKFLLAISNLRHSRYPNIRIIPEKVLQMLKAGFLQFSVQQWAEITGTDQKDAENECQYMYEKGWMSRIKEGQYYMYSLRIDISHQEEIGGDVRSSQGADSEGKAPPGTEYFQIMMSRMATSRSDHVRLAAESIQQMLKDGKTSFTRQEWMEKTGMSRIRTRVVCDYLVSHKLVDNVSTNKHCALYVFSHLGGNKDDASEPEARPSETMISELHEMLRGERGVREKSIGTILLSFIEKGIYSFRARTVMQDFSISKNTCTHTLRAALNLGYLHKEADWREGGHYLYVINRERATGSRADGLTQRQKEILTALYRKYKSSEFSVLDGAEVISLHENSTAFHLHNFAQCGILTVRKGLGRADHYTFAVTPKQCPDCFLNEPSHERAQSVSSSMSAIIPLAAASV